jgi:DNA-binding IclR family transcriptional regulator
VPVHCSASGKVFLAQMAPVQRQRLLSAVPLEAFTPRTVTDPTALEAELQRVRREGCGFDDEEFLPGLVCAAVPVSPAGGAGRASLCVAVQGPAVRLNRDKLTALLPALREAADSLARLEADAPSDDADTAAPARRAAP